MAKVAAQTMAPGQFIYGVAEIVHHKIFLLHPYASHHNCKWKRIHGIVTSLVAIRELDFQWMVIDGWQHCELGNGCKESSLCCRLDMR